MKSEAWREDACRAEMSGLIICTWEHACWAALAQPDADRPPRGCSLAGTQLTAVPPRRGLPGLPRQQEGDTTDPAPWRLARLPGGGLRRGVIQATTRPHAPPFGSLPLGHRCPWLPAVPALHRHGARFGRRDQPPPNGSHANPERRTLHRGRRPPPEVTVAGATQLLSAQCRCPHAWGRAQGKGCPIQ